MVVDGWDGVRVAVLLWWVGVRDTMVAVLACWVRVLWAFRLQKKIFTFCNLNVVASRSYFNLTCYFFFFKKLVINSRLN